MAKMKAIDPKYRRNPIVLLPLNHITSTGPCVQGFARVVEMMVRRGVLDRRAAHGPRDMQDVTVPLTIELVRNMMSASRNVVVWMEEGLTVDNRSLFQRRMEAAFLEATPGVHRPLSRRVVRRIRREELAFIFCEQYRVNDKFYREVGRSPTEQAERKRA